MNKTSIVQYRPLIEVTDMDGNSYYTDKSIEELENAMDQQERLYFPISKRGLKVSRISSYGPADPAKVTLEWELQNCSEEQRQLFNASKQTHIECWGGTKPITPTLVKRWCDMAKNWEVQKYGR